MLPVNMVKYNNAVRALNTAELSLTGACRRVSKYLPEEEEDVTVSPTSPTSELEDVEGDEGGQVQHSPTAGPTDSLGREFSGVRPPPTPRPPRRRILSTNCNDCKDREREIGMDEADAQVGRCPHGVDDHITELTEEGGLPTIGEESQGLERRSARAAPVNDQERLVGRRVRRQRQPTPEAIEDAVHHMENCYHVVVEKQQAVIELSVWYDEADKEARLKAIYDKLGNWDELVQDLKIEAQDLVRMLKVGQQPATVGVLQQAQPTETLQSSNLQQAPAKVTHTQAAPQDSFSADTASSAGVPT